MNPGLSTVEKTCSHFLKKKIWIFSRGSFLYFFVEKITNLINTGVSMRESWKPHFFWFFFWDNDKLNEYRGVHARKDVLWRCRAVAGGWCCWQVSFFFSFSFPPLFSLFFRCLLSIVLFAVFFLTLWTPAAPIALAVAPAFVIGATTIHGQLVAMLLTATASMGAVWHQWR